MRWEVLTVLALALATPGCATFLVSDGPPIAPALEQFCSPMPAPDNPTRVDDSKSLAQVLAGATNGEAFLLAAGTYTVNSTITISAIDVRVIGTDRDSVIIETANDTLPLFSVVRGGLTLANLTLRGGSENIHVEPPGNTDQAGPTIHYVVLEDAVERNLVVRNGNGTGGSSLEGVVTCNRFVHIPTACDTGHEVGRAILIDGGADWLIRRNEFHQVRCNSTDTRAVVVQRGNRAAIVDNLFFDGDAAIGLGSGSGTPSCPTNPRITGAVVCNNLIQVSDQATPSGVISMRGACDALVVHNSITSDAGTSVTAELGTGWLGNNAADRPPADLDGSGMTATGSNVFRDELEFAGADRLDLRLLQQPNVDPVALDTYPVANQRCGQDFLEVDRALASPGLGAFEELAQ